MDRIWQWAWDRHGARYSWAVSVISFAVMLQIDLLLSFVVVAFEDSDHYVEAAAVTVVAVLVPVYVMVLPGLGRIRLSQQWAAGHEVDRARALEATYTWARGAVVRAVGAALLGSRCSGVVGAVAGATGSRLVQYGILGAAFGRRPTDRRAQLPGGSAAASQGRHRR